jgi:type IV pilus assembly protein PilV
MLIMTRRGFRPRRARGVTLIEVLVAIVITSLGVLTLAGTQVTALRQAKQSQNRAVAVLLAGDLAERMRANHAVGGTPAPYAYQVDYVTQAGPTSQAPTVPTPACDTAADNCSAAQMAAADLYGWRLAARDLLPGGAVYLLPDPNTGDALDVWVAWNEPAVLSKDEVSRTSGSMECPSGLSAAATPTVRCLFLRVQL